MSFKRINGSPFGHTATMICPDCKKEYELPILEMTRRSKFEPCLECKASGGTAYVESLLG